MLKVGLTGGIGSGKSTVAKIFNMLGVPVYFADERSKYLLDNSVELISAVKKLFGEKAYTNGKLNREFIASVVFTDKTKLESLNKLAHPAVKRDFANWCIDKLAVDYVIMEAAILFESGTYKQMDMNILVVAPEEMRIKRVMERDKVSAQLVINRIKNQWTADKILPLADIKLENSDKKLILPQILKIHKDITWQNLGNG